MAMPGILETAKKLMSWNEANGFTPGTSTRSLTWSAGEALAPILPPSIPGSGVTTAQALSCPPVARGVGLFTTALLGREWDADPVTLEWLTRSSEGAPSSKHRDVRTLVDLILHNRAMWIVSRDSQGRIYEAMHFPASGWAYNADGQVVVGDTVLTAQLLQYVLIFPGLMTAPFLETARDSILQYSQIARTVVERTRNPVILTEIKLTEAYDGLMPGEEGYAEEADQALATQKSYAKARQSENGSIGITPPNIDLVLHQANDDQNMYLEARNAVRLEVASHLNLNAELLDGNTGTSDNYSNTLQDLNEFELLSMALYLDAITLRLSQDDVTPPGQSVKLSPLRVPPPAKGNLGEAVGNLQNPKAGLELGPDGEKP